MQFFEYGQIELDHLRRQDHPLGLVIDRIGILRRPVTPDLFSALARSVVGQQISNKAASTVWNRFVDRFITVTPQAIAGSPVEEVQRLGISTRKAGYIKGIADSVLTGKLDLASLSAVPDSEVIRRLSALPGIGVWTAEMLLIFSMQRPDVLSWGDLAIRRGIQRLYGLEALERDVFERYRWSYSPFGSVASLYLWEIARDSWLLGQDE